MNKKLVITGLLVLSSHMAQAQGLPDEVNYSPYYDSYVQLRNERDYTAENLENSRETLEFVLQSIRDKESYIVTLLDQIKDFQKEKAILNRELPDLNYDLNTTERNLREVDNILSDLRNQEDSLNRSINSKRQTLAPLQRQIRDAESTRRSLESKISSLISEINKLEKELDRNESLISQSNRNIDIAKKEITNLENNKSKLQTEMNELTREVSKLTSVIANKEQRIVEFRNENSSLKNILAKENDKLNKLIQANESKEKIIAQKSIVENAKKELARSSSKITSFKATIESDKKEQNQKTQTLNQVKTKLANLPSEISSLNRKIQNLQIQISTSQSDKQRILSKLQATNNERTREEQKIIALDNTINRLVRDESQVKDQIAALTGRLQNIHRNITSNESLRVGHVNRISELRNRIYTINLRIPELDRFVSSNHSEITKSKTEISQLNGEESTTRRTISQFETQLNDLNSKTNNAYSEYQVRSNLYNRYSNEASTLGSDQVVEAYDLGKADGLKQAQQDSEVIGQRVGKYIGKFNASLIGIIRGENTGYDKGYQAGYSDDDSITQATFDGDLEGKKAAFEYAEKIFKPEYFEAHLLEELHKPVKKLNTKVFSKNLELNLPLEFATSVLVPNLNQNEIDRSLNLVTSLDLEISKRLKQEIKVLADLEDSQNPMNSYDAPDKVPYGVVNCNNVYKGLQHFKDICLTSYSDGFSEDFYYGSEEKYQEVYKGLFDTVFTKVEESTRNSEYQYEYDQSFKIAFNDAKLIGKKDIYANVYANRFEANYAFQLPLAKKEMDIKAKAEMNNWILDNPIITIEGKAFSSQSLRGGDKGVLRVDLKNISFVNSMNPGLLKIKNLKNLIFKKDQFEINSIAKKSLGILEIPFTVDTKAASGELIEIKAELDLPGDKYKAKRVEVLNLSQSLILNPKIDSTLKYDEFPKVKAVFKYYVHTFTALIQPAVENIDEGYSVELKALNNEDKISFKQNSFKTKALNKGEEAEVNLSYSFTKAAKDKDIQLELIVKYKDLIVKKEIITLKPR